MAIKGLSIPVFGKYNHDGNGKVTYTDGVINPHAVSYSIEAESTDNNPFYADNRIVENDKGQFNTGTLTLETDDLDKEISMFLLGLKELTRDYGNGKSVKTIVYDDSANAPSLGFGIIVEHQRNDVNVYEAVILKKVIFTVGTDEATTRGDSIDWQTTEITGTISRSDEIGDGGTHPWKEKAEFAAESDALEFLKAMLGVGSAADGGETTTTKA